MDRYSDARLLLSPQVHDRIRNAKVLVFGAGGIGCELLKNMVLVGFENIHVVDMDTVDVSNLNRQFLFRVSDVGKPKSEVAASKVTNFNPRAKVKFYHQNLFEFGLEFYEQFDICVNGLDNIEARKQVNRMCLNAGNLPMIDGGTQGYDGQVMTTHRGKTECYECQPKNPPKSYPVCTIRSNPSKLVHCVVWGKHLFSRLFGVQGEETDFLKEISEIMSEIISSMNPMQLPNWERIFLKLFHEEIEKLIKLKENKTWERGTPIPLKIPQNSFPPPKFEEQAIPALPLLIQSFYEALSSLSQRKTSGPQKFDKDDDEGMKFVFAVANLRAMNFRIPVQSYFDVKAIAGSIIPAIATSNAIIAGLQVFEAIKILSVPPNDSSEGRTTTTTLPLPTERSSYLRRVPATYKRRFKCLILGMTHSPPNKQCYICQSNEMCIRLYLDEMEIGKFASMILMKELGMKDPWICFNGSGIFENDMNADREDDDPIINMDEYKKRKMSSFGIIHGSQITGTCNEMEQLYWKIMIIDQSQIDGKNEKEDEEEEEIEGENEEKNEEDEIDKSKWYKITSKQEGDIDMKEKDKKSAKNKMRDEDDSDSDDIIVFTKDGDADNNNNNKESSDDDEVVILDEKNVEEEEEEEERKREREEEVMEESERKKRKIQDEDEEDVIMEEKKN